MKVIREDIAKLAQQLKRDDPGMVVLGYRDPDKPGVITLDDGQELTPEEWDQADLAPIMLLVEG